MGDKNWGKVRNVLKAVQGNLESSEESGCAKGREKKDKNRRPSREAAPEPQYQPFPNNQQAFGGQGYPGQGDPALGCSAQGPNYSNQVYSGRDYPLQGGGYPIHPTQSYHGQSYQPQPVHEPRFDHAPPQQAHGQTFSSPAGPSGYIAPAAQGYPPTAALLGPPTGHAQSQYDQSAVNNMQGYPQHAYGVSQNPSYNAQPGFTHDRPAPHQSQSDYDANSQQQAPNQGYSQYPSGSGPSSGYLRRVDTAPAAMTSSTCHHGTQNDSSYALLCSFVLSSDEASDSKRLFSIVLSTI